MTWLQQVVLVAIGVVLAGAGPNPTTCNNIFHKPDSDVVYRPEDGQDSVDLNPGLQIDTAKIQVPVVIDVIGRGKEKPSTLGETTIGVVTTDGQNTILHGSAINGGQPVTLGPDCKPKEPLAEQPPKKSKPQTKTKPAKRAKR